MNYYISFCNTSGFDILPNKVFPAHDYPASFILALCRDESATYAGSRSALLLFLSNPAIHALLKSKSDKFCPDYNQRLVDLDSLITLHKELLK